jgi:hypothetical protein
MMGGIHVFARGLGLAVVISVMLMSGALAANAQDCNTEVEQNRPILLGVSGGNLGSNGGGFCCSGTLGSLVQVGSSQYILSNNHVLATRTASQRIIQPGLADLNCVPNSGFGVASGVRTIPISPSRTNTVDAAIARVIKGDVDSSGRILNIGNVAAGNAVEPTLNLAVQKMGSTTCETSGSITAVNVTIKVRYTDPTDPTECSLTVSGTVTFTNQIQIGPAGFSGAGDSGSLIVTTGSCPAAVGLLFAGSIDGSTTFANPMTTVLKSFGAMMVGKTCGGSGGGGSGGGGSGGGGAGGGGPPTGGLRAGVSPSSSIGTSAEALNFATGVKQRHEPELLAQPGVLGAGVGVSSGQPVIKVYVDQATPAVRASIPSSLEAVPVQVEETGQIVAY